MKSNKSNQKIIRGLEYLDDDVISGVLGKIKPKNSGINNRLARRNAWIGAAVTIAACAILLALSIPTMTTLEKNFDFFHIGEVKRVIFTADFNVKGVSCFDLIDGEDVDVRQCGMSNAFEFFFTF